MKLKNIIRKASALIFGICVFSAGGVSLAASQPSYVYASSGSSNSTGNGNGTIASTNGEVANNDTPSAPRTGGKTVFKPGSGYVPVKTPASKPNPNTGTVGTDNGSVRERTDAEKNTVSPKLQEANKATKEEEKKEEENKSTKTKTKKSYVKVDSGMPDMSLSKTSKGHVKSMTKSIVALILDVFVLVGFVMIAASSGMLVFAFKDENADAKMRATMGLATGVALCCIFAIFKATNLFSHL